MQVQQRYYTPEEYLELEVQSIDRHEYINGEMMLMAGGTPNHNTIAGNFHTALNVGLRRRPYQVFITDQRLWIPEKRIYTYPDVMVVAQPIEYQENRRDTLINPVLVAEVLSKSTRTYDKDDKFTAYRTFSSFQEYLLIDQYTMHVEHYFKSGKRQWTFVEYQDPNESIELSSLPCQIVLADLYDKVDFDAVELEPPSDIS